MTITEERLNFRRLAPVCFALLCLVPAARAQAAETITATAQVKSAGGVNASAPVTLTIDRLSTDAERDELLAAIKKGGTESARKLLELRNQLGVVRVGTNVTAIKYTYQRTTATGRLLTIVTGLPIAFVGAGVPGAKPKTGYDLGLVLVDLAASGPGHGELLMATKVAVNDQGAIVTEDYSVEKVLLSNAVKK